MTLEIQPAAPAYNVFITNMAGRSINISHFKINNTELIFPSSPFRMTIGEPYSALYNEKYYNNFERMILEVKIDQKTYKVDLNKDHYFGGGDFHYPGKGAQVNYMLFGVNSDQTKIQFCLAYGEYFGDTGAKRLLYSNDTKYLDAA